MKPYYILIAFILVNTSRFLHAQEAKLTVVPERDTYVVGEPIILHCRISNESQQPTEIDLGYNEVTNFSFIIHPDDRDAKELPYAVRRGGGKTIGEVKLTGRQTIDRFLVLDQWIRPTKPGLLKLECVLNTKGNRLVAPCKVTVEPADLERLKQSIDDLLEKYKEAKKETKSARNGALASYRQAVLVALSYIADSPGNEILKEIKRHGDPVFSDLIEEAQAMGPGGRRIID